MKDIEQRVKELEERVAELEGRNSARQKFVPEDSEHGNCYDSKSCTPKEI